MLLFNLFLVSLGCIHSSELGQSIFGKFESNYVIYDTHTHPHPRHFNLKVETF